MNSVQKANKYLVLTAILFLQYGALAQYKDFETWLDLGLNKKMSDKLSIGFEESIRLNQNSGSLNNLNSTLGIDYEITDFLEIGLAFRLTLKNRPNGYYFKHRGSIDLSFKKEINQYKITYRNRTQLEKDYYINNQEDLYPQMVNRNRLKLSYNIRGKRTDPYIAIESFHLLNQPNFYQLEAGRIYFGLSRKFPYELKFNLSFIYEKTWKKTVENVCILNVAIEKSF